MAMITTTSGVFLRTIQCHFAGGILEKIRPEMNSGADGPPQKDPLFCRTSGNEAEGEDPKDIWYHTNLVPAGDIIRNCMKFRLFSIPLSLRF
ncbi:hypothetical protein Pelo_19804 [Pelomyxa schiedti]|nr:hypothetical protein Pelo_19804 [Pelomyxa schiedti]